ncbi:MAG: TonB-dependent receptor, partial [Candidatus Acidiferrum sp.]
APNISELYAQPLALLPNVNDPVLHTQTLVPSVTGGNPHLVPETANTTTFGVVIDPDSLPGFQLSVDYYRIRISNVIDSILPQEVVNLCTAGNRSLCQDVVRDSSGALQRIFSGLTNLATLDTEGIDIVMDYQLPLSRISTALPGAVDLRVDATNVRKLLESDPATGLSVDRSNSPDEIAQGSGAGNAESAPKWQLNAVLTYTFGPLSVTGQERWVSAGRFDPTSYGPGEAGYNPSLPTSINNNHVDASYYTKLGAEFTVRPKTGGSLQFFAVVDNLFDQAPPPLLYAVYAGTYHDLVGRTVRVGARYKY